MILWSANIDLGGHVLAYFNWHGYIRSVNEGKRYTKSGPKQSAIKPSHAL